jgi:ribosomal protein L17
MRIYQWRCKYKEVKPIVEKLLVLGKKEAHQKTQLHRTERSVYTN